MTTYNRAEWLAHSLRLIVEQTKPYQDFVEVVVCDNASTDQTPQVVRSFGDYPHLYYRRHEKNVGMLGNLAVSANHARGRYVWLIGDDDLLIEGTIERVLSSILHHPTSELLYLNYAYTHFDRPGDLHDVESLIHSATPISTFFRDVAAAETRLIAAKTENCFTAVYCLILRADHARRAYNQDTSGAPFTALRNCVPSAEYVCREMFRRPAYWIGDPAVVVNMNVSWLRYASLYVLERFPELHDLMVQFGASPEEVDVLRERHLPTVIYWLGEIYFGNQREHLRNFSIARLIQRFRHVSGFQQQWPKVRSMYEKAFNAGVAGDDAPDLETIDRIFATGKAKSGAPAGPQGAQHA